MDPEDPDYHYNLANTSYDVGDFETAASEWAQTLEIRPNDSKARNNYCDALLQLGKYDDALKEINLVLENEPEYPPALCTKGEILEKLGKKEEAQQLFAKVATLIKDKAPWKLLYNYLLDKIEE
jgi:tetratricopeptide (TPR) repeat protein